MTAIASQNPLIVQQLVQVDNSENIKLCIIGPLWVVSTGELWIPITKDQWCKKHFMAA